MKLRIPITLVAFCALWAPSTAFGQVDDDTIALAGAQFRSELLIEAAGIFWIAAEVAILFCMSTARRIFDTRPFPGRIELIPQERRRALLWCAGIALLVAADFGRHLFITPLPDALEAITAAGDDVFQRVEQAYNTRTHIHIAIWCGFITIWVAIEIAIVAQGIGAFRRLKRLTTDA